MTFSNVHHGADGWEGLKPWVVGIYDDGAGAITYALGTLASGQNVGGNSEGGSVGGGGTSNDLVGYIQSFDVHVVTDATDIQEFTYNDIDNTQRVKQVSSSFDGFCRLKLNWTNAYKIINEYFNAR